MAGVPYLGPAWVCGSVGPPWNRVERSQAWPPLLGLHRAFALGGLPACILLSRLCPSNFPSSFWSHFLGKPSQTPQASSQGPCPTLGALSSPPLWRLPSCNFSLQCHIISRPHPALACLVYSPTSLGSSSQKLNFSAC